MNKKNKGNFTSKSQEKVLVIGLDGGTWHVIEPLVKEGKMPNIERIMKNGVFGTLHSTHPPSTAPAWTSFMTGKNPSKHGILGFQRYNSSNNRVNLVNYKSILSKTLWEIISEKKKKVIAINVPLTYPPPKINGIIIAGFGTPSLQSNFTYPSELRQEILDKFEGYDFLTENRYPLFLKTRWGLKRFLNKINKLMQIRSQLAIYLMEKYDWDIFMVHFHNIDIIQHVLWNELNPDKRNKKKTEIKKEIIKSYTLLDTLIGNIFDKANKCNAVKFVISDHGFGPYHGSIFINKLLTEWKLLSIKKDKSNFPINLKTIILKFNPILYELFRELRNLALKRFSKKHINQMQCLEDRLPIVWSSTKVFSPHSEIYGFIYIKLRDRDLSGIVKREDEYEKLRSLLINKLIKTKNPINNERIFEEVLKGEKIYNLGTNIPDIVVIAKNGFEISSQLKQINRLVHYNPLLRKGTHRREGIFIAEGRNIKRNNIRIKANIIDIAPTVLNLLNLRVPDDMDGRVLSEIFINPKRTIYEHVESTVNAIKNKHDDFYSKRESKEVRKLLKSLGYID